MVYMFSKKKFKKKRGGEIGIGVLCVCMYKELSVCVSSLFGEVLLRKYEGFHFDSLISYTCMYNT